MSRTIPEKEAKLLYLQSGCLCAFPGCGQRLIEPGTPGDDPAIIAEVAHIVAGSRQGPRGKAPLTEQERNMHANLILFCPRHHKVIDSQCNVYSIPVLQQMKADHEARVRRATAPAATEFSAKPTSEAIHSTLMSITQLPDAVFTAPCCFTEGQNHEVKERIVYPNRRDELVPFCLGDKKLFAFQDLRNPANPFSAVLDLRRVEVFPAIDLWRQSEGRRRYVALLNRSLQKYAARLGIRYDPDHRRFHFTSNHPREERTEQYRSLTGRLVERHVAWQPRRKSTGQQRHFWWHLAACLQFHQMAERQWTLSIRPERHLTQDGENPLPPAWVGPWVTSLKARMYNDLYLAEVNFWRYYLARGLPRFILNFGNQSAVIDTTLLALQVCWPGIPGDEKPFESEAYEEDLFSLADHEEALAGERIDWHDVEDLSEEESEESEF